MFKKYGNVVIFELGNLSVTISRRWRGPKLAFECWDAGEVLHGEFSVGPKNHEHFWANTTLSIQLLRPRRGERVWRGFRKAWY